MFNVNNRSIRTSCEICLQLTIKTQDRRNWRSPAVTIVNFEHFFSTCSSVSIVNFEQANAGKKQEKRQFK